MEEIRENCVDPTGPDAEYDPASNSPPKLIKKLFVLDPGKLKALGLDAKIKSALAKKKKTVTKKQSIKPAVIVPETPGPSATFIEKKIPDKNKEIKIISVVNVEEPIKFDSLPSFSRQTNVIQGFSNFITPKIEPKIEVIQPEEEFIVPDVVRAPKVYIKPASPKQPQEMIYKTTDKNNKETVYKIYLTSISKKSANNNDSPTKTNFKSPPDKQLTDLATIKKNSPHRPDLQKKIIENFNKVFANTPVKFNETVDTEKNTKTSSPNCVIYKSQGGTLTPIKMVCKSPRVSSVKIISKNSPEVKSNGSFSKIDISKLKAKLNENLRRMSGATPEKKTVEKSLIKIEPNQSPKSSEVSQSPRCSVTSQSSKSIENVSMDAMNRLNEYLKKIQEEKKLNKNKLKEKRCKELGKKYIAPISGISAIKKSLNKEDKHTSKEFSSDGEQFLGFRQVSIKESSKTSSDQLKIMKKVLKENQKELSETLWKMKIDQDLNISPTIEVNKSSKTYSRVPKKIPTTVQVENEDSDFDFDDMPFESIDCNVVEYSKDNLIDQKDISIVIQSESNVFEIKELETTKDTPEIQMEVVETIIPDKVTELVPHEETAVDDDFKEVCEPVPVVEETIVPDQVVTEEVVETPKLAFHEETVVNKIEKIFEPVQVNEEEPKPSVKSFKQMDIRNCFKKSFKKKMSPPPKLTLKSANLEVKEMMIEKPNSESREDVVITKFVENIFSRAESLENLNDPNGSPLDEIISKFVFDIFTKIESLELPIQNEEIVPIKSPVRRSRRVTEGKLSVEDVSAVEQSLVDLGMLDETNSSDDIIVEETKKSEEIPKVEVQIPFKLRKGRFMVSTQALRRAGSLKTPVVSDNHSVEDVNHRNIDESVDKEVFSVKDKKVLKIDENIVKFVSKDEIKKSPIKIQSLQDTNVEITEAETTKIHQKDSGIVLSSESFNEDEEISKTVIDLEKTNPITRRRSRSLRNNSSVEDSDKTPKRVTRRSENNESQPNVQMVEKLSPKRVLRKSTSKEDVESNENTPLIIQLESSETLPEISENVLSLLPESTTNIKILVPETKEELPVKVSKRISRKPIIPVKSTRSLRKSVVDPDPENISAIEETNVSEIPEELDKNDSQSEKGKISTISVSVEEKSEVSGPTETVSEILVPEPEIKELEKNEMNEELVSEVPVPELAKNEIKSNPSKGIQRKPIIPGSSLKKSIISVPEEENLKVETIAVTVPELDETKTSLPKKNVSEPKVNENKEEIGKIETKAKSSKRVARKPIIPASSSRSLRNSIISVPVEQELEVPCQTVVETTRVSVPEQPIPELEVVRSEAQLEMTEIEPKGLNKSDEIPIIPEKSSDLISVPAEESLDVPLQTVVDSVANSVTDQEEAKTEDVQDKLVLESETVSDVHEEKSILPELKPVEEHRAKNLPDNQAVIIKTTTKRISKKPIIPAKSSKSLRQSSVNPIPKEEASVVQEKNVTTKAEELEQEKPIPSKRAVSKPIITEKSSRSLRKSRSGSTGINLEVANKIADEVLITEGSAVSESHDEKPEEVMKVVSQIESESVVSEVREEVAVPEMLTKSDESSKDPEVITDVKKKPLKRAARKPTIPQSSTRSLRKSVVKEAEETTPARADQTESKTPELKAIKTKVIGREEQVTEPIKPMQEVSAPPASVVIEESFPEPEEAVLEAFTISEVAEQPSISETTPEDPLPSFKEKDPEIPEVAIKKSPTEKTVPPKKLSRSTRKQNVPVLEITPPEKEEMSDPKPKSSKRSARKAVIPEKTLKSLRKSGKLVMDDENVSDETKVKSESKELEPYHEMSIATSDNEPKVSKEEESVAETPIKVESPLQNKELSTTKKTAVKRGRKKKTSVEPEEDIQLAQMTPTLAPTTLIRSSRRSRVAYKDHSDESDTEVFTPRTSRRRIKKEDSVIEQPKRARRANRLSTTSSTSDRRYDPENEEESNGFVEGDDKLSVQTPGKRGRSLSSVDGEFLLEEVSKKKKKKETNETKKRRGSAISDDLNESKKSKADVVCGNCKVTVSGNKWKSHLLGHNGIGWIVGEEPDWDLNERNLVLNRMLAYIREMKLSFVTCEKCGTTRKSALGLMTHQEECGLDSEAIEKLKITCEHCGSRLKAYSLSIHLQNHCFELKNRQREEKELQLEKEAKERETSKETVVVTESGRIKRRSVLKAEHIIKATTQAEARTSNEDYIGVFHRKKITGGCTRRWAVQIKETETAKCLNQDCQFTSKTVNDLLVHSKSCQLNVNGSGFLCLICKLRNSSRELIRSHIEEAHQETKEQNVAVDYELSDSEAEIDDESSDSADDDSGDEEDDEESAGAEEEDDLDEDYDDGPKTGHRKYALAPNILENMEKSKMMMVDYKTVLVNSKRTPFFSFALDWTKDFRKRHFSVEPLYRDIGIKQFNILTSEESKDFLPLVKKSPNFYAKISDKLRVKFCNAKPPPEWKNLETFEGISLGGVPTFYCGGPVTAMDWVPFPDTYNGPEVLAVVVKNDIHNSTAVFELQPVKCIIQVWEIPDVTNAVLRISSTPKMRYAICFPYGPVWQIKFCPSGGYFDDGSSESRLGLMAVTSLIGEVYLYALPIEVNLNVKEEDESHRFLDLQPSAVLTYDLNKYKYIEQKSQQMTKITWSEAKGHSVFAAGYTSGMVCVWKIDTKSILLLQRINDVKTILPIQIIKAHNNCISALSIFYADNSRYMMTGCKDRSTKFYDLQSVPVELTCNQLKSRITCGVWPLHWSGCFLSFDEGYAMHRAGTSYVQPLDIGTKQTSMHILNSSACDMDFSDWLNSFVVVSDNGDIVGGYCKQLLFTFAEKDARRSRFVFGCTEVVELEKKEPVILNSESSYPDKYGLIFCDILDPIHAKQISVDLLNSRRPPIEEYPLTQINQIRCNRNADAYKFYALGYQAGFVRIRSLRQVK